MRPVTVDDVDAEMLSTNDIVRPIDRRGRLDHVVGDRRTVVDRWRYPVESHRSVTRCSQQGSR